MPKLRRSKRRCPGPDRIKTSRRSETPEQGRPRSRHERTFCKIRRRDWQPTSVRTKGGAWRHGISAMDIPARWANRLLRACRPLSLRIAFGLRQQIRALLGRRDTVRCRANASPPDAPAVLHAIRRSGAIRVRSRAAPPKIECVSCDGGRRCLSNVRAAGQGSATQLQRVRSAKSRRRRSWGRRHPAANAARYTGQRTTVVQALRANDDETTPPR
jgi:hypothetical protein